MSELFHKTVAAVRDVRTFGVGILGRYVGLISSVNVPSMGGKVYFRKGNSDFETLRQVIHFGTYDTSFVRALDSRITSRYREILSSGRRPVIIDAGANIGAASLWYCARYPEAAIVAIEPDPGNCAVLKKNVNQLANITVVEGAVGSSPGTVSINQSSLGWATQTVRAESGLSVVTIDEALKLSGGDDLFIVKIDIEGFESDLFSANLSWLADVYVVAIEPHDWMLPGQRSSGPLQKAVAEHEFEIFIKGETIFYVRM